MAWLLGICLGVVVVAVGILVFLRGRREELPEDWLAEADGSELDLPAVPSFSSRSDPVVLGQSPATPLHVVLEDLGRRATKRHAEVQRTPEAPERINSRRPLW